MIYDEGKGVIYVTPIQAGELRGFTGHIEQLWDAVVGGWGRPLAVDAEAMPKEASNDE